MAGPQGGPDADFPFPVRKAGKHQVGHMIVAQQQRSPDLVRQRQGLRCAPFVVVFQEVRAARVFVSEAEHVRLHGVDAIVDDLVNENRIAVSAPTDIEVGGLPAQERERLLGLGKEHARRR